MMDDTISRQAAIDALNKMKIYRPLDSDRYVISDCLNKIVNLPSAHQWIPCSERLPGNKKKRYWICTDTGYQCECRWTNTNPIWTNLKTYWHWNIFDVPQYSSVVAWMPLPEPYKQEEKNR